LDGKVDEIKEAFRSNEYVITFKGNMIAFTNALWTGYEIVSTEKEPNGVMKVKLKGVGKKSINDLLKVVVDYVQILSINEYVPSMNEIFIQKVSEIEKTTPIEENE
jgi:ABC-2 type transport system ATP-binding protein